MTMSPSRTLPTLIATARWDEDSDPRNPGWVVDIEFRATGECLTLPAAPHVYHAPRTQDPYVIIDATLHYEGLASRRD